MTRIAKLYNKLIAGRPLSFSEFQKLLLAFGYKHNRTNGSHLIYRRDDIRDNRVIQPQGKMQSPIKSNNFWIWSNSSLYSWMIEMTELRYNVNLFWHEPDNCWIADVPDLRGCSAHGATPEEAAREVQIAMELWIEVAREYGDPIPEPRYRPAIYAMKVAA